MLKKKEQKNSGLNFTPEKKVILFDLLMIAAVITVVVLVAYKMNGIYPFGDASIARGDMVQQTIPAGMYYVWDILHGKASPFFTWNSAFGMNISGATSLGAFLSPLNLFLLFTTRANIVYFANILMILKMIAIAFAMYFYLRKYDVKNIVYVIGGILYAFGAASLVHFQIMLVMDVAFLLPLIMIGVDRIFANKGCKFFIVMLALGMMVNIYTGCITLIFIFLSSALRNFWDVEEKEEKRRCALQLGVSVVLALLLSAVVTIPALHCISTTSRTDSESLLQTYLTALEHNWLTGEWEMVKRMVVNIALPVSAIIFFLTNGSGTFAEKIKKYKSHLCMVSLLVISVVVSATEMLWHGGSRASWPIRFVYVISFVLIDFAMMLYHENKEDIENVYDRKKKIILGVAAGVATVFTGVVCIKMYTAYCQEATYSQLGDGFLCILLELLFIGAYWCIWKSKVKEAILVFLCVQVTCTSVVSFAPNKDNVTVWSPEYLEAANNVSKSIETEIKDFERIKNMDYKVDNIEYSLVMGKEAISNYWHVISPELQPNFAALGYSINWTQLLDTGGTIFTDTLFNTKYYLSQEELPTDLYEYCQDVEYDDTDIMQLYKNKFELPFAINTNVSTLSAQGEKFAAQNNLFNAITGNQTMLIQDVSGQVSGNRYTANIGNDKKILYFYGTNSSDNKMSVKVNGEAVQFPASFSPTQTEYPVDFCNGLVCLGSFQNEQINVEFSGADESDVHLGLLDYNTFVNGIEGVKSQNPEIISLKQGNTGLKMELENVTKSNLFLPISHDDGWVCKVNGEKVSEIDSMDGMLSIPVENGKNSIELKYVAPGQKQGLIMSVCALMIMVAFWLLTKKKMLATDKAETVAGYVAYVVFISVFVAVVVLLFAIPVLYYLQDILITIE